MGMPFPGPLGMQRPVDPRLYQAEAFAVRDMAELAIAKHHALLQDLNGLTENEYARQMGKRFTASKALNMDNIDWRVPRLMLCKDPKYNMGVPPPFVEEVMERKTHDGVVLEEQMSREAYKKSAEELKDSERVPPPLEYVRRKGVPFVHAVPHYDQDDDLWQRRLELRSLDEALRGDVSQPLPRPVLNHEDMDNFRSGKYVKDDCPIA